MYLALVFRYTGHPNSSQAVPSFSIVDINNEFLLPDALPNAQHIHYQLVGTALGNQMFHHPYDLVHLTREVSVFRRQVFFFLNMYEIIFWLA